LHRGERSTVIGEFGGAGIRHPDSAAIRPQQPVFELKLGLGRGERGFNPGSDPSPILWMHHAQQLRRAGGRSCIQPAEAEADGIESDTGIG
jgi:hypothetical protein